MNKRLLYLCAAVFYGTCVISEATGVRMQAQTDDLLAVTQRIFYSTSFLLMIISLSVSVVVWAAATRYRDPAIYVRSEQYYLQYVLKESIVQSIVIVIMTWILGSTLSMGLGFRWRSANPILAIPVLTATVLFISTLWVLFYHLSGKALRSVIAAYGLSLLLHMLLYSIDFVTNVPVDPTFALTVTLVVQMTTIFASHVYLYLNQSRLEIYE